MPKLNPNVKEITNWKGLIPQPDKFFGFIYQIVEIETGMLYLGKKQYWKLNPKRTRKNPIADTSGAWNPDHWKASDWPTYTGSCDRLNEEIAKKGRDAFNFIIIGQYCTKGDLVYAEVEALVKQDALTRRDVDGDRMYYNGNISAIRFIPPNKDKEII